MTRTTKSILNHLRNKRRKIYKEFNSKLKGNNYINQKKNSIPSDDFFQKQVDRQCIRHAANHAAGRDFLTHDVLIKWASKMENENLKNSVVRCNPLATAAGEYDISLISSCLPFLSWI